MLTRALVSPSLIGRDDELRALVELRLAAARGHGCLVLVSGDAGIGKTRLLQSFRKTLRGGRAALGVGLCREFGNEPYGPIREAMRAIRADPGIVTPAATREEQLATLVERLVAACSGRNVALLIEDLQWADDGTLAVLHHLLPVLSSLRLLVVATYRSDEARRLAQMEPHVARLVRDRSTHEIKLQPLTITLMRQLVRSAAGSNRSLSVEQIEGIAERSDGNPLFAEELLKNSLASASETLPFTVRATVLERVAGLDARARDVLSLASVLGRRFGAEFLSVVSGIEIGDLLPVLRRLRNLQLIDEIDDEPLRFTFRHALTREAVYGELLAAESQTLHGRILRMLEETNVNDTGELGYHAWAARDPLRAARYNECAGDEARALHAYSAATRCYQRALEFALEGDDRGRLSVKAAQSCAYDGKSVQAIEFYEAAIAALRDAGRREQLLPLYREMSAQARTGGDNQRAIQILEEAMTELAAHEPREAAMLSLGIAHLRLDRGEVTQARALIARAEAAAGTLQHYKVIPYAALVTGDVERWRKTIAQTLAFSRDLGSEHVAQTRFNLAFGLTILGFDAAADAEFDAVLPDLRALRLASLEVLACANLALLHARHGRLAESRTLIERAAAIPEPSTTGPIALAAAALTVGYALWDEALVERLVSEAIVENAFRSRINSTLGRIAGPYARWLRARGDEPGAHAVLRRAMPLLPAAFGATETFLAAAEFGDESARSAAFDRIAELEATSAAPIYAATATHLQALRAQRRGMTPAAQRFAKTALALYRRLEWPIHEASCLELLNERKRAVAQYRRVHAPGTLRDLHAKQESTHAPGVLSDREQQIATLVASGHVNKRIAELLAVNQRTIEKHLTSIYGKLGLRNRSELAAFIARSGS